MPAIDRLVRRGTPGQPDGGSAMIITLMVMALVTALATTVATVAINNLQSSFRAQQAGSAVNAADAGVAQALSHLRAYGVRTLNQCSPNCVDYPWGNSTTPVSVSLPGRGGQKYTVWIEAAAKFPQYDTGRYVIHSTGTAGGNAQRMVTAEVHVTGGGVPRGVVARTIAGGGTVTNQSVFSMGCVYKRDHINISGEDYTFGIPAAVHSAETITSSNGGNGQDDADETGQYCPSAKKPIHTPSAPCNNSGSLRFDQDSRGGDLKDTPCATAGATYPNFAKYYPPKPTSGPLPEAYGSYVKDAAALLALYGVNPSLTQSQVDQLRAVAEAQGNLINSTTGWSTPDEKQAVMYFDLKGTSLGGTVDLKDLAANRFVRPKNLEEVDSRCQTESLIIVIEGGNARLNGNIGSGNALAASLFLISPAPNGQVDKANGNASFVGDIYADKIDFKGSFDISMDKCALNNSSPTLLDFQVAGYSEVDSIS